MSISEQIDSSSPSGLLALPVTDRLPKGLELLESYVAERGWEDFRSTMRVRGVHLGHWVVMRRMEYRRGTLPAWLVRRLEAVPGWSWDPREEDQRRKLDLLRRYIDRRGWERLTEKTVVDGVRLKLWATGRKQAYVAGNLPAWLRRDLDAIPGWSAWVTRDTQLTRKEQLVLDTLRQFVADRGWVEFQSTTHVNGVPIGRYVGRWRSARRRGRLRPQLVEALEAIAGWSWQSTFFRDQHRRGLALLRQYVAEFGWQKINRKTRYRGFHLGSWCEGRRGDNRQGKLADWLRAELEAIPGWRWRLSDRGTPAPARPPGTPPSA